jgi:hypothetical protein
MRTLWLHAPLCALFWSALARGQAPPPPPPPLPAPAPLPSVPPPASVDETGVRAPDTAEPPPIDQGPDRLPSLEEVEAPPKPAANTRPARAHVPRPRLPIRADRRLALTGELGWNGLAGFGAIVSYHANPHLTFDLGVGLAIVGGKLGLRARYNFLEGNVTPFLGAGFIGATGFDAPTRDLGSDDSELNLELKPSAFLQTVAGIDWTRDTGFTFITAIGYATMLTRDNLVIITGEPTEDEKKGLDIAFRSGIVISIALGYSFR